VDRFLERYIDQLFSILILPNSLITDTFPFADYRLGRQWAFLENLPQRARDAFFAAFRYLYESEPNWSADLPESFTLPWVENIGPPQAKSDRRKR